MLYSDPFWHVSHARFDRNPKSSCSSDRIDCGNVDSKGMLNRTSENRVKSA
jgi:hypothetical protein